MYFLSQKICKLLTYLLCNYLYSFCCFSVSRISASHIQDFGPCYNVKSHVCCCGISTSCQKTEMAISKNNSSIIPTSLEKNCLRSCVVQCKNCTFIYLFSGRGLLPKSTLPGWRLLLNLETHFKWEHFGLIGGDWTNNQCIKSLLIVVG